MDASDFVSAGVIAAIAAAAAFAGSKFWTRRTVARAQVERRRLLEESQAEAEQIKKASRTESREWIEEQRKVFENEVREGRKELKEQSRRISKREDGLERKIDLLNKKERKLEQEEQHLHERDQRQRDLQGELEHLVEEEKKTLYRIAEMSKEEAEKVLLERLDRELEHEKDQLVSRMVERTKETVEARARDILATSIQRLASQHCQEVTVSSIELPNDEMKGRIIGREGRNIRAFEKTTGVDVIVDDTPGVITLSCFDSIRREMARRALDKLIADGRIHPTRIEEVVAETKTEMNELIQKTGKQVTYDLNIAGLNSKLITLLGRLKFRTSYGQNVLDHVVECATMASMIAAELGVDAALAKRCALFHDIGKAVDHQFEGGHPEIGASLLQRYDEPPEVVNSAASHHNDVPQESIYAVITQAADSISGSRPGARGESLERYIQRLEKLESVVNSFPGVQSAQAIQAGREVRVFVNSHRISDKRATRLAHDIAKKIETELTYPGEIKVTLIRETRVVEYAR
ncbi:MAG: ribonuclease Y [Planctomycetes bacterium]|nr:ribonuclease Y [Planctomycetota bacterium]